MMLTVKHGLQVRGSIPLYWNQEGVTHLKPDITLQHYDPLYTATRLHFEVPYLTLPLLLTRQGCLFCGPQQQPDWALCTEQLGHA